MNTILLDRTAWDMVIDASGNIAMASDPYALAQDAASEIRLFQQELYYDTTQGVPYFQQILGKFPPVSLLKARFIAAALNVPEITKARCFIRSFEGRKVTGQVQTISAATNQLAVASF